MKKICLLLAMILALACVPALAAEGDAILGLANGDTQSFSYCFAQGDTLYLVSYGSLFTYHVGDADVKEYSIDLPEDLSLEAASFEYATMPFTADGKLYSLNLLTEYGENSEFKGASISELTLKDEGTAASSKVCDVDWSDMVEYYDNSSYPVQPDVIIGAEGHAFARYYNNQGNYQTVSIDLATGETQPIDALLDAYTIVPYRDGRLLVELYNPELDRTVRLASFNPADGSLEQLCEIEVEEYSPLVGLGYDAATDMLYCVKGGEVCPVDLQAGVVGEGVTDMPLESYSAAPGCILDGGYFAFCSDGAAVRNLDPAQKAQTKLRISDSFWSDSVNAAYYRFANAHGDVSVVMSRDYAEVDNLIENMMNREDRVDVYVLAGASSVFEALYNRGYLMELDGNEKVKALAEGMYPSLRDMLSTNGHMVAVPVSAYGWSVGVNAKALEKLGLQLSDVPETWSGFLDFLAGLDAAKLEQGGIHLVSSGYSASDVRYELLNMILLDYQYYVNRNNPELGYDTPLVHELLEKLEKIDFVALGLAEDGGDEAYMLDAYDEESVLLQTSTGCSIGNFYGEYTPVLLRVSPDAPACLALDSIVVVVNPFTKNPDAALAFVGEVVDCMAMPTRYSITPDLMEPIRGAQYQAMLDELKESLDEMRAEYEKASAEEKQSLEADIQMEQSNYDYAEATSWEVAPREVEWYRAHDDNLIIAGYNWLYPDTQSDEDSAVVGQTAEAEALMDQYLNGQISLDDMLKGIDRKVQMRRMEGN